MAENSPAVPPACTMSRPPGRNFGTSRRREVLGHALGDPARAARPARCRGSQRARAEVARAARLGPARIARTPARARARRPGCTSKTIASFGCMHRAEARGERARQRVGLARELIDDAARPLAGEERDRVDAGARRRARPRAAPTASPPRPRRSRSGLARLAERRAVDLAGTAAADVADDELQRAADRRVGAVALPEALMPAFMPMRAADRAVDHDHRARRHRRREQAVHVELVGARGLDRGEHHRQVLGLAAGHHRVDRHLLDRARGPGRAARPRRPRPGAAVPLEHAQHPRRRRRHDRQAIGPAAREAGFDLVLERRRARCGESGARRAGSALAGATSIPGSVVRDPQPGRASGRPASRSAMPVTSRHSARFQPTLRDLTTPCSKR